LLAFPPGIALYVYVLTLGMFLPSLVLYYYVLKRFGLYDHHVRVLLILQAAYASSCYLPLFYLFFYLLWKLLHPRRTARLTPQHLVAILRRFLLLALTVVIIIISLEASLCIALFSPVEQEVRSLVDRVPATCRGDVECSVREVVDFINAKLRSSWSNPMSSLEIDSMLSQSDYRFLRVFGFSRAHVILWQGWGSCGQYAIATTYLLSRLGFTVRVARFLDIDHSWAEVSINSTWYIVDPWYIGIVYERQHKGGAHLVPASALALLKGFRGQHRVLCTYLNATEVDCTGEHGY